MLSLSGARLQAVSEWLGFSTKELPATTQASIKALAGIADALEIKDCSDTCYCLALCDLCQRRAGDAVKRGQLVREIERAQEQIRRTLVKQANQRRLIMGGGGVLSQTVHSSPCMWGGVLSNTSGASF